MGINVLLITENDRSALALSPAAGSVGLAYGIEKVGVLESVWILEDEANEDCCRA